MSAIEQLDRLNEAARQARVVHIWGGESAMTKGAALCGVMIDSHPECYSSEYGYPIVDTRYKFCPSCGRPLCPDCLLFLGAL